MKVEENFGSTRLSTFNRKSRLYSCDFRLKSRKSRKMRLFLRLCDFLQLYILINSIIKPYSILKYENIKVKLFLSKFFKKMLKIFKIKLQ